jgi:hypothetical protein
VQNLPNFVFSHKSVVIIYGLSFLQLDKESSEIFQSLDHRFLTPSRCSGLHFGCYLLQIIRLTTEFFFKYSLKKNVPSRN